MKDIITDSLKSLTDLKKWDEIIFKAVCSTTCISAAMVLEAIDDELAKDRDRELRMIGKRPKTIVTKFGSLKINRRMYKDKSGRCRFLLDESIGLIAGSQATAALQTTALKLAALMPFRQAATVLEETSGGVLSHQMIHRILQLSGENLDALETITTRNLIEDGELPKSQDKKVERLFVEADGTMINLQREIKRKAEVKLFTAHEGWEEIGKNKYKLINKTVLAGLKTADEAWNRFTAQLLTIYHPQVLSHLIIGGDGATWIRSGADLFMDSTYQLDRFHLRRAMLRATGNIGSASKIYSLAAAGEPGAAIALLEDVKKRSPRRAVELKKAANYIRANITGLVDYRLRIRNADEDMRGLGAIESNIDKIIANRMKKRGMAWSYSGAHNMAKVIQMLANKESTISSKVKQMPQTIVKTITRNILKSLKADPSAWLTSRMPALIGPHQSRPWVKHLRDLSQVRTVER